MRPADRDRSLDLEDGVSRHSAPDRGLVSLVTGA